MPYNNTNALTDKEFYAGTARLMDYKASTIRKYWEDGLYEFIVRELFFRGSIRIPHLGTFSLKHLEETYSKQTDANGNPVVYKVPERDIPVFTPHDTFINDVNNMGVTKKFRKRAKAGKLNPADIKRQERADLLGDFGSMSEERQAIAKGNFAEKLAKLKEENGKKGKS